MSTAREPGMPEPVPPDAGDDVAALLRLAGPREPAPVDRLRRIHAAAHAEWKAETGARRQRRMVWWTVGTAAAAVLALALLRPWASTAVAPPTTHREVATIEAVVGAVRLLAASPSAGDPALTRRGDRVREGEGIDTSSGGRATLRLSNGATVRIDGGARVRLMPEAILVLDQGAVYVASRSGTTGGGLEIRTPVGTVRDIGTQFEVRLDGAAVRVRVREGLVRLVQSSQAHDARAGDELTLDGSGRLVRRRVPVFGPDWQWITALPQPFALDGRSLIEFLDWVVAENGWRLRFADDGAERKARTTTLHGSIDGLSPEEALEAVLPASGVAYRLEDGVLRVFLPADGRKG